ncbi:MAG TPA: TolC family protein [Planctomycetes bacterium]|nr:TolC family protein [Planctomycetota bacterium]
MKANPPLKAPSKLALITVFALASCWGKADFDPGELDLSFPERFTSDPPRVSRKALWEGQRWWESLRAPELDRLIREGLEGSRSLAAAAQRIAAARAQAEAAGGSLYPQVSAGLSGSRTKQIFVGFPIPGRSGPLSSRTNSYGLSLNLSWELDLWGKLSAQARSATLEAKRSEELYQGAALSLSGQMAKTWFALIEAKEQERIAKGTLETDKQILGFIEGRYRSGKSRLVDVQLAKERAMSSETTLARAKRLVALTTRQLEYLLGRPAQGTLSSATRLPPLPPAPPAGLPASLLDRRPDLRAARLALLSRKELQKASKASLYPSLSLTASAGTRSNQLKDLIDGDFSVWSLAGNILQPIFMGGTLRAQLRANQALAGASLQDFADKVLRALLEVEQALSNEQHLREELKASLAWVSAAKASEATTSDRYRSGRATILETLNAKKALFQAQSALSAVRRNLLQNRVDLCLAMGGRLDPPETSPQTPKQGEQPSSPAPEVSRR